MGGRGGGVPLKLGVSSRGEHTKSGKSSLKCDPSGVLFPPVTRGEVTPVRWGLHSAGRGGKGLVGAGDELFSANCRTSSSRASSSRQTGGKLEGEKLGGKGGAGSSGGGGPSMMEGGESKGVKGAGDPGENGGGDGGGSFGGGPGERQGVDGVDNGVPGAGESGGGGGAGSSGGGGLSSMKETHLGETVSSRVRGLPTGPNTSSRSGAGEPRWDAGDRTFR